MASGTATNRTNIDLPVAVSDEILQKIQTGSKVMQLARRISLPGRGAAINVVTGDPSPAWVGETELKSVSDPGLATKVMRAYKLAVVVPFSNEFRRDVPALYDAIIERIPAALGEKFDNTVFFGSAPGSDFDTLASVTGHSIASDVYGGLVAADGDVADHGGVVDGWILSPKGRTALLSAVDGESRPLFNPSTLDGGIPRLLGAPVHVTPQAYKSGSPSTLGIVGDWSQAMYGMVNNIELRYSSDATLKDGDNVIYLFQQNMFAVIAEVEIGFRANTDCFAKLTSNTISG